MDILQADQLILDELARINDLHKRAEEAGYGANPPAITLDARQRTVVIGLLKRYSREPVLTKDERKESELGVILCAANCITQGPDVVGTPYTDQQLQEAVCDMMFVAMRAYINCNALCIKMLKPETQEVLSWVRSLLVTARAGGYDKH